MYPSPPDMTSMDLALSLISVHLGNEAVDDLSDVGEVTTEAA